MPDDIGLVVKQMRQAGVTQPIVGGDGYDTPLLLQVGGKAANDVYFSTHAFMAEDSTPQIAKFYTTYKAAYNTPPENAFAALGYDTRGSGRRRDQAGRLDRSGQDPRRACRDARLPGHHRLDLLSGRQPRAAEDGDDDRRQGRQADPGGGSDAELDRQALTNAGRPAVPASPIVFLGGSGGPAMIDIEGKIVLTEIEELVDPSHTALIVIDMQRDFIEPDGLFGSLGIDLSMYAESRPRLAALLAAARKAGTAVMHLQNTALPDRKSDSPAQIRFNLRMHKDARRNQPPLRYTIPGTPGHEFAPDFMPREDELVVRKYRSSGFWGTNLAMLLRSNGIKTVVVGGCTTEGCVESTARDAMFNDFYVVIAEDCVASDDKAQHDASMLLMRHRFDIATGAEIQRLWQRHKPTQAGPRK